MKLKFERFEDIASFSVRGLLTSEEVKILQIGLESLVKDLGSTLVINLTLATYSEVLYMSLQKLKKTLAADTKHTVYWVSTTKGVGDYPNLNALTTRLTGAKLRQVGDRLMLEDETEALNEKLLQIQKRLSELGGDEKSSQELILKNTSLKEESRILKQSIHHQKERMKVQTPLPSTDEEVQQKIISTRSELEKTFGKLAI